MAVPEKKFLVAAGRAEEAAVLRGALEEAGWHNVTVVDDGEDALRLLKTGNRYFVIAAWELPRLGGLRLAKEVRGSDWGTDEPILLVVPERPESEILMAEGAGINGFLVRPVARETVRKEVARQIGALPEARWPSAQEDRADDLADEGDIAGAMAKYRQALDAGQQRLAALHTEAGVTLMKLGRVDEAVDRLEAAAAKDPNLARAQEALGRAYLDSGRPAEASRAFERAAGLDPGNHRVQTDLAESYLESGRHQEAETLFRRLLDQRPEDGHLLNRLGIALRRQGKFDRAVAHYRDAIRMKPGDENLYFNLGRSYHESGDFDRAQAALGRALDINPDLTEAQKLLARVREEKKEKYDLA